MFEAAKPRRTSTTQIGLLGVFGFEGVDGSPAVLEMDAGYEG
jgi:hypothetical protein